MNSPISAELPIVISRRAEQPDLTRGGQLAEVDVHLDVARTAFDRFYRAERTAIARALSLTLGDRDLAAEATDEAMVRAYQRWSRVGTLDHPAGWVFRVGLNYGRSRLRRVARKFRYTAALPRHDAAERTTPFADRIGDDRVMHALDELGIDQRSVVVLRVLLGFSEAETAEVLDIRPGTAKSRLHRALTQLRRRLPDLAPDLDEPNSDDPDLDSTGGSR